MRPEIKGRGAGRGKGKSGGAGRGTSARALPPPLLPPSKKGPTRTREVRGREGEGERGAGGALGQGKEGERAARTRAGSSVRALVSFLTSFASTHTRRDGGRGGKKKGPLLLRAPSSRFPGSWPRAFWNPCRRRLLPLLPLKNGVAGRQRRLSGSRRSLRTPMAAETGLR